MQRLLGTLRKAGAALHAVLRLDAHHARLVKVNRAHGANLGALATKRAGCTIGHGILKLDELGQVGVMLNRAKHEFALARERALLVGCGFGANGLLNGLGETIELAGVVLKLFGDGLSARKSRVAARNQTLRRADGTRHKLAALVGARKLVGKLLAVDLKAKRTLAPLLSRGNHVGVIRLTRGGAAAVAHTQRQVNADVVIVCEQGKPKIARHHAQARQHDLIALGKATDCARAGDIGLFIGRGSLRDAVVEFARRVLHGGDGLGGTSRDA